MIALRGIDWLRLVVNWLTACFALTILHGASAADQAPGAGYVDRVRFNSQTRELFVAGWAAPERKNVFTSIIILRVGDHEVYRGRLLRLERPDVVQARGREDWLWSGWQIRATVPRSVPDGPQPIAARVRLTDGAEFDLPVIAQNSSVTIEASGQPPKAAMAAFVLAVLVPLLGLFGSTLPSVRTAIASRRVPEGQTQFAVSVAVSFTLLVAAGLSGSSLGLGLSASPVTRDDSVHLLGGPQPIRSDEWLVTTPMAISQVTHDPPFPVVNRNIGPEGQNMLIVGMTGVPVNHISSLARPATWGLLLLDLRRGLAWYWWFPFFACFTALWLFLTRLFRLEWRIAAVLAATLSASPYSIGWSGWPAYVVSFPLFGIVAADRCLRIRNIRSAMLLGALLGLCIAGFALVLYPAWQVAITYLLIPVALAVFIRDRRELCFGLAQLLAGLAAVAVAAFLLIAWWQSALDAIEAIRSTVYPGQRSTAVGGDIDPWYLVKGLLSPITMYQGSAFLDQSDAGSFIYLLPALVIGVLTVFWIRRGIDLVAIALLAFVALALTFLFTGFNPAIARYSLWGLSVPFRIDIALGLAQTLLLAWLISSANGADPANIRWVRIVAIGGSIASALCAAFLLSKLPPDLATLAPPGFIVLSCLALGWAGFLLLARRSVPFVALYAAWMVGTGIVFNPIALAPTAIVPLDSFWRDALKEDALRKGRRVAVVGEQDLAMTVLAAGIPILNGVFYYPQQALWQALDPAGRQRVLYNRHHRLMLVLSPLPAGSDYQIDSPRLDEVRITLDPARFDFRTLGADLVLTSTIDADALVANSSLRRVNDRGGWVLHRAVN